MVVARAAAAQAAAAELALPDGLALWALAGGRPSVEPQAGQPEDLGDLLEASFDSAARRRQGAHYTPSALATGLVERALGDRVRPSVGDPACGGGALLLAAARHLAARGEDPADVVARLWGVDIDPVAVATTEAALALWSGGEVAPGRLSTGDALLDDLSWPALDVVVGNPPFLTPLDADTARSDATAARWRERFGAAVRPYTDTASVFLLRACDLVGAGGTVALLQPQSVLAARDAAGVRGAVAARGRLADVWFPPGPGFDASVDVCVPIVEVGEPEAVPEWSAHLARANGVPVVSLDGARRLGDEATTTAAFRSEYYGMVDHVHEQVQLPSGRPLVTTGLIDLGRCRWGERSARIGKCTWERPVLDVGSLAGRAADWVRRTGGPKLVVATQTRVVEVVVDEDGAWVAAVPLIVVLAPPDRLWSLAAALAAPASSAWLLRHAAGTGLTAQSLKASAALLRAVPLPTDVDAWQAGTVAFRAGDLAAFAAAMSTAYGTGPDVAAWWTERATTVWSPPGARR